MSPRVPKGPEFRIAGTIDRAVALVTRSWAGIYLLALGSFLALPIAAPILAMRGQDRAAGWIYAAYRLTCHQLPHHSWFLGGARWQYTWSEVQPATGLALDAASLAFHHPIRDSVLGYQLAFCQRDLAIWSALFFTSLLLLTLRKRRRISALRLRWYLLALVPMAVDGLSQLVGLRESTPLLRSITGAIFGAATAWLVVPLLEEGFQEMEALRSDGMREP
jgi:uncharacterized membrane protein